MSVKSCYGILLCAISSAVTSDKWFINQAIDNEVAIVLCASEVRRQTSRDHATRVSASLEGAGFALDVRLPYRSMEVSFGFPIDGLKVVFVGDEGKQAYTKTLPL